MKQKRIKCTYSNVLRIRVTHTMIPRLITSWSKTHCCLKDQADGMDVVVADRMEALKKKDGPSRARLKSIWLSVLHV
jgi:hypothetical protein